MKYSANLGFLWTDLPLPDAIRAAARAGFHAVECHWPYDVPADDVAAALRETGLPMLGLNTVRGDVDRGENGLAALPDRIADARAAIDQAIRYAHDIGAKNVHVMCGKTDAPNAGGAFVYNLQYAADQAAPLGIMILIEPLNTFDVPGYFLTTTDRAITIIKTCQRDNIKLMFDCYHVQRMQGNIIPTLTDALPHIGHVQFAGAPDRGRPDRGELNYPAIFDHLKKLGWEMPLGAEYKPDGPTDDSLGWMDTYSS